MIFILDHASEKSASKSRQFDLFSLIFGDEFDNQTESETAPTHHQQSTQTPFRLSTSNPLPSSSSAGDSIFAAIEAGLKYIESNDNKVGSMLDDTVKSTNYPTQGLPTSSESSVVVVSSTTESELSFLDILLGDDEDEEGAALLNTNSNVSNRTRIPSTNEASNQLKTTEFNTEQRTTNSGALISADDGVTDLENSNITDHYHSTTVPTTIEDGSTKMESTTQFTSTTNSEEIESTSMIALENISSTPDNYSTTEVLISSTNIDDLTSQTEGLTDVSSSTADSISDTTTNSFKIENIAIKSKTSVLTSTTTTPTTETSVVSSTNSFDDDLQELLSHSTYLKPNKTSSNRPKRPIRPQIRVPDSTESTRPNTKNQIKATTENIFSALFGGISNIFSDTNTTTGNINRYKIRVNNDTNGSVNRWPKPFTQRTTTTEEPIANLEPRNVTSLLETTTPLSTSAAIVINSNPSILESDLNYDYGEPTLPPSLPNLNIIPFLPTDAVKTNRNHGSFGFVRTNSTSFPTLINQNSYDTSYSVQTYPKTSGTINDDLTKESKSSSDHNDFELFQVGAQMAGESPDRVYHPAGEDGYNHHSYPSITEPNFDANDHHEAQFPNFSKYGNHEYHDYKPYTPPEHRINEYDSIKASSDADVGYGIVTGYEPFASGEEYKTTNPLFGDNQFSPPNETEGKSLFCLIFGVFTNRVFF